MNGEDTYDIKEFLCGEWFRRRAVLAQSGGPQWFTVEDLSNELLHSLSLAQGHIQKALRVGCIVRSGNHYRYRWNEERFPLSDYEDDKVKAPMERLIVRMDPTDRTDQGGSS